MIGYLLQAIAAMLSMVINIAIFAIVARAVLSFVSPDPSNPIVKLIYQITDPMLRPFHRWIPPFYGVDWTPMVLLLILYFIDIFAVQTISRFALAFL
ncbi:MAG: YggT family protein [Mariprofundaceae bacterium]|nr:YggT family protein [Mariprofundaceae bacterium]